MKSFTRKILAVAIAVVTLLSAAVVAPTKVAAYSTGNDYPYKDNSVVTNPNSNPLYVDGVDKWGYYIGQCTSFVAWCLESRNGLSGFRNWYGGVNFGDAGSWGNAAKAIGITVDNNPAVGSVGYNSGHVAWVAAVNGDKITIEEYNSAVVTTANPRGLYHVFNRRENISKSTFSGFIHFKDISVTPQYATKADNIGDSFNALVVHNGNASGSFLTNDNGTTKFLPEKRDKSQIMQFKRQSDGSYTVTAMSDGKALDVQDNKQESRVYFYPLHGRENQRYFIEKHPDGKYFMFGTLSPYNSVLDMAGGQGKFSDGTQIWTYSRNDSGAQWVEIRKIDDVNAYLNPPATLASISIATPPTKTAYTVGDTLDTAGLAVTAKYSDNSAKSVGGFTCSPTTFGTAGTQTVTATFEGKSATFAVVVSEAAKNNDNSTAGLLNGITLTATVTDIGVKFDWSPNNNAHGYRIYRSKTSGVEGISITDFPITAKDGFYAGQYVDVNVERDTRYYYTIRAVEAEAGFDIAMVEIIPERLGAASEELTVTTSVIANPETPTEPDKPTNSEPTKHFMLMTIDSPQMLVDDDVKEIDPGRGTSPIIKDGRTLTPIRAIIENMDGSAEWSAADSKITLNASGNRLEMWVGNKRLTLNGAELEMDIAPAIINERTMLPLRFVSDNVGCQIAWIGSSRQIVIVYYAVLIRNIPSADNAHATVWTAVGYSVLLCFGLFKSGNLSKSLFQAH
ncbi:hypothetical protein FACS1894188_09190 [Clostridia bacterium]|nr:hypothetical protein FACS1894188_09190 [Clostridia bacterium]